MPVVTLFGLDFAGLLTGTIFVEKIFDIDGLGLAGLDAEQRVDLPMLSAVILIGAALIVLANIAVDVVYSVIDPRVGCRPDRPRKSAEAGRRRMG